MEEARMFDKSTPAGLIRVINAVALLLDGEEKPKGIRMSGSNGTDLQHALNIARGNISGYWVIEARVKWLEYGLDDWERKMGEMRGDDPDHPKKIDLRQFIRWTDNESSNTLSLDTLSDFMTRHYVSQAHRRLQDRFFGLLIALVSSYDPDGRDAKQYRCYLRRHLVLKIMQRTGCWHPSDPHRDEICCRLLLERYDFDVPNVGVIEEYDHDLRKQWMAEL